jgi:hypothetical protein
MRFIVYERIYRLQANHVAGDEGKLMVLSCFHRLRANINVEPWRGGSRKGKRKKDRNQRCKVL